MLNKVWLPGFVVCDMTVYPEVLPPKPTHTQGVGAARAAAAAGETDGYARDATGTDEATSAADGTNSSKRRWVVPFHLRCLEMRPPRRSDAMLVEVLSQGDLGHVPRAAESAFIGHNADQARRDGCNGLAADALGPTVVPSLARCVRSASRLAAAACAERVASLSPRVRTTSTIKELARGLTGPPLTKDESREKRLLERFLGQGEVL